MAKGTSQQTGIKLDPHNERRVSVEAGCDPRTVRGYLAGRPVHSTTANRIRDALRVLGLDAEPAPREEGAR
jgi:hypothetical protein